jgi:hypothetical protein
VWWASLVFKCLCTSVTNFGENLSQPGSNEIQTGRNACTRTTSRHDVPHRPHRRTAGTARRSRPATAGPRPGSASTVCLRGVTRCPPLGRCQAAAAHTRSRRRSLLAEAPPHIANRPRAHADALWTQSSGETTSTRRAAYKPPLFSLACARRSSCPPPSSIDAAGELPPPLVPVTYQRLQATP